MRFKTLALNMWTIYNISLFILKCSRCRLVILCGLSVILIGYSLYPASNKKLKLADSKSLPFDDESCHEYVPSVGIFGIKEGDMTLAVVQKIFNLLGYKVSFNISNKWDVLWSYTYPFYTLIEELSSLKHHQKVNHFPGTGYITQKSNLAVLSLESIPKSFIMPIDKNQFIQFTENNKNKSWMMKSSTHRDMKIIDGNVSFDINGAFIQEFIRNPLLINGKKFDIGVYVMLTSIDPLRVYVYSEDILLRFCKINYHPLNLSIPESYIVGDDYLPVWEVPDLQFYFSELNYTAKVSLNAYLQHQGKSVETLWLQIYETIRNVYTHTEEKLKQSSIMYNYKRGFFELVRFDFIVDEGLKVFLLEVNMSPNLSPAHFPQNSLLYEQIVFNSLSLIGLIRKFPFKSMYR